MIPIQPSRRDFWSVQMAENGIKSPATIMKEQASSIAKKNEQ
ncbi:MAG: hypothetical protein ACPGWR_30425 [Ardenticatenaceae bacterium]